jgi:RNA polymerase sigma-70 factor (ECF subfamily)
MDENDFLAQQFEAHRTHLGAVAYRMLGSHAEADDAVQEAWFRLSRSDTSAVDNLGGWLTTVVARLCLDMLRSRTSRREELVDPHVPDPVVEPDRDAGPEHQAVLADSVGLALLVVLELLPPAERIAFVLHDMFAVPFDDIATIVDRSPAATRQLASRARRRVQGAAVPDPDVGRQRRVVDAFFAAAERGDFDALVSVLDPDVVLRADTGTVTQVLRGAPAVAGQALMFASPERLVRPVLVNGGAGVVIAYRGAVASVMGFTVVDDHVVAIDVLADPDRLARLDLSATGPGPS